jgi:hypothetical protein
MSESNSPVAGKPGYKTTEFWLSLAATLLGVLLASGAMDNAPADSAWSKIIGGAVAVLASLGYSASRAKVKSTETLSGGAEATSGRLD